MPLRTRVMARSIFQVKTFLIKYLERRAVRGRTRALLMETKLGKICVTPKMRHKFSKKSQTAGSARATTLV